MTDDSTFDFNRVLQKLSADEKTAEGAFKELYGRFAPVIYTRGKRTLRSSLLSERPRAGSILSRMDATH